MTDEPPQDRDLVLPTVALVHGYMVTCSNENCGRLKFIDDESEARRYGEDHRSAHRAHEQKMRDMLADGEDMDIPNAPRVGLHCPTCRAVVGEEHQPTCDVARCLDNGGIRALRDHMIMNGGITENHDCGHDVWTGYYPGEKEAAFYGVTKTVLLKLGRWDRRKCSWVLDEGYEQKMLEQGLAPMPNTN